MIARRASSDRVTPQLEAVYRAVEGQRDHPTARQVFERVRRGMPRISLGTVYRNLDKLARVGRLRVLRLESGASLYDAVVDLHDHFICDDCGIVIDVAVPDGAAAAADERLAGHQVRRRTTTLFGTCRDCSPRAAGGMIG